MLHCVRKKNRWAFYEIAKTIINNFNRRLWNFFCLKSPGDKWIVQCTHKNCAVSRVCTLKKSSPMFQIVAVEWRPRFTSHQHSASPPLPSVTGQDFGLSYLIKLISTIHAIGFVNNLSELQSSSVKTSMKRMRYFTQCERQELQSDWFLLCPEVTNLKLLSNSLSLERSQMIIPKEGTIYPLKAVIILFCELKNVSFEEYINPYQHAILKKMQDRS